MCFLVVSPTSFANVIEKWLLEIRGYSLTVPIIHVGTHSDLRLDVREEIRLARLHQKPVTAKQVEDFVKTAGLFSDVETSALTQKNLKEVMEKVITSACISSQRKYSRFAKCCQIM